MALTPPTLYPRFQSLPEISNGCSLEALVHVLRCGGQGLVRMLKISVVEGPRRRRLILEGKLTAPWAAELVSACEAARADLHGRQLIVDMRNLTAISTDGESVLLQLMSEKIKFQSGVFMKEVLRQLARKRQRMSEHPANESS
jgi:anti-anti-sigma regulatory factor